jgi:hypothetical protein
MIFWDPTVDTAPLETRVRKNGTFYYGISACRSGFTTGFASSTNTVVIDLANTDYFEIIVTQGTVTNLDIIGSTYGSTGYFCQLTQYILN